MHIQRSSVRNMPRTLLVLGARNLGGAIADHFKHIGWSTAAVARSEETVAAVTARGHHGIHADASDPRAITNACDEARERFGSLDAIVNAVSLQGRPPGPFGGGPLIDASPDVLDHYMGGVARQAFAFLSAGAKALRASGGGALIQVTGGSSRRAIPGRGAWAAGAFATRALTQAAAQELRTEGVHVALLVVDATIESPKTAEMTRDQPREELADQAEVAKAAAFLVEQGARGMTHELVVTPAGDRWVP
jgi:NAD(P)-dependent dehydrogenase (short-subunit alcohol dehydrogenase family)